MKQVFTIFVFFLLACCNATRHSQLQIQNMQESVLDRLEECLKNSICETDVQSCPNHNSKNLFEYYREEISKFNLKQALAELDQWRNNLQLDKSKDTIALIFFYPAVGFDSEQGYITEYYIYGGSLKTGIAGESSKNSVPFKISRLSPSKIREKLLAYRNYKGGCESGLLAISYLHPNLEPSECYVAVGISLFD